MSQNTYKHWNLTFDEHHSAYLSFDKQDASANSINAEVMDELEAIIARLTAERPNALVIRSAKKSGFIAGADIRYFKEFDKETALRFISQGQKVFHQIAALPFPTIAVIHGFCMGGGMELALACQYRIADTQAKTRLGLPEVLLGIQPGWGGSIRLLDKVGTLKGLDLILNGRTVNAKTAYKMGMVDAAVPTRILQATIDYFINKRPISRQKKSWLEKLVRHSFVRVWLAKYLTQKVSQRVNPEQYPAPFKVIENWQEHGGQGEAAYKAEVESIASLITSNTTQQLIRVFFLQEQLKALGRDSSFKAHRVHVVGAGVMGGDIAVWCALKGMRVTLQDPNPQAVANTLKRAASLFKKQLKEPHLIQAAFDRLLPDPEGSGIARADVIIEAIVEKAEVKRKLFQELEAKAQTDAILASNTSTIPLEQIGQDMQNGSRVVGIHFFNPVAKMRLVEVVYGEETDETVIENTLAFVGALDKLPLPVKSSPGFLVNRILMPYIMESVMLYEEGVPASVIDKAALKFGMPMGPLELADTVGLDVCLLAGQSLSQYYGGEIPSKIKALVDEGHLGRKSGQGFYEYVKGKVKRPSPPQDYVAAPDLADRLFLRMINESVACLREGVVSETDWLDAGLILGTGFPPYIGGPMQYIRQFGHADIVARLTELHQRYGKRFQLDEGWHSLDFNSL